MKKPIYLDYNATTPVDPVVLESLLPYLKEDFGNPSSRTHAYGWDAESAVTTARKQVASLLNCHQKEIIWTSGATESNNIAIYGIIRPLIDAGKKPHIITSAIEHKAVLCVCNNLAKLGAEITFLKVDKSGKINLEDLKNAIQPNTALISIMTANNEIGTIQPIKEIGQIAKSANVLFHTDAAQGCGKLNIDVEDCHIDLLSASGHKMYAPKGVGFLYIRKKDPCIEIDPLFKGGMQEGGIRPGTQNVPGIVGMGCAAEIAKKTLANEVANLTGMRDKFIQNILKQVPEAILNGHPKDRIYSNISFSFTGLSSDVFALGLSGLAVSSGSACNSANAQPSHVLLALGVHESLARATVRFGIGKATTWEELEVAAQKVVQMVEKNRDISIH